MPIYRYGNRLDPARPQVRLNVFPREAETPPDAAERQQAPLNQAVHAGLRDAQDCRDLIDRKQYAAGVWVVAVDRHIKLSMSNAGRKPGGFQ
jgi:hypothetical protein